MCLGNTIVPLKENLRWNEFYIYIFLNSAIFVFFESINLETDARCKAILTISTKIIAE